MITKPIGLATKAGHARKSGEWGGGGYRRQASRQSGASGQAAHSQSEVR